MKAMRALTAYSLVRLAAWIYPPLISELVETTINKLIELDV